MYGALEDAHYDAMGSVEVEAVKQKLGLVKEDPSKPKFPIEIELAGDSIWDRDEPNPKTVTVTDYKFEKDEEGYVSLYVMHNGPWTIYTDSGFEKEMSEIVGMELSFSEQGMQDDGVAHLEGGEAMESVSEGSCGCGSDCACDGNCTSSCNCGPSCNDTSQADVELAILKRNAGL